MLYNIVALVKKEARLYQALRCIESRAFIFEFVFEPFC